MGGTSYVSGRVVDPQWVWFGNLLYALGATPFFFLVHPNPVVGESTDCHRQAKTRNESICCLLIEEGPQVYEFPKMK